MAPLYLPPLVGEPPPARIVALVGVSLLAGWLLGGTGAALLMVTVSAEAEAWVVVGCVTVFGPLLAGAAGVLWRRPWGWGAMLAAQGAMAVGILLLALRAPAFLDGDAVFAAIALAIGAVLLLGAPTRDWIFRRSWSGFGVAGAPEVRSTRPAATAWAPPAARERGPAEPPIPGRCIAIAVIAFVATLILIGPPVVGALVFLVIVGIFGGKPPEVVGEMLLAAFGLAAWGVVSVVALLLGRRWAWWATLAFHAALALLGVALLTGESLLPAGWIAATEGLVLLSVLLLLTPVARGWASR